MIRCFDSYFIFPFLGKGYEISYVTTNQVETVDTTGAGDSVVGALAYFLACHPTLPFKEAVRRSIAIATITVTSHGVQSSYPAKKELPSYLFDDTYTEENGST